MSTLLARAANMDVSQTLTPAQTKEQYTENYCGVAAAAMLLYDYVVTLDQERRYIWTDVRVGYVVIFLVNRLNMLCMAVSEILFLCSYQALKSCSQVAVLWGAVVISTLLLWACVSTLRVYAISNRSASLAATTAVFALVPIPVNIFSFVNTDLFMVALRASTTCAGNLNTPAQTQFELVTLSRASLIASDAMVLVVTWWQLWGTLRPSGQGKSRSALAVLLLRDNSSYFVLFLLINIAQMALHIMLGNRFNPIATLISPITCIVISRLILNLRQLSFAMRSPMHARRRDTTSPPISTVPSSFHPSLLSTIVFGPKSQGSQGDQMLSVPLESPSRCSEGALESGPIDVADYVMDDIIEADEADSNTE
ncbi:uncharacterized protein B0H18DRAFT_1008433 [Fomitopsis serialis]|uniref:uncharacterized protein n=1 Tax=Fomitopsis serialis TaxID=139415 RepID=UPI002007E51A|nr:uncharacterized protein B0H18DRAFT_1008433 [Neoantrodia serialis]KAH9925805.1 hypothetical protein B0H18DRAFT_1008433 [Neoantrodia serialis]